LQWFKLFDHLMASSGKTFEDGFGHLFLAA
jgi:hypothetical protein